MNKRQLKKAMKKKGARALINQVEYLRKENVKLRKNFEAAITGLEQIKQSFNANVGALTRLYGDQVEECSIIELPLEEIKKTISDYEVTCSVDDGKYIIMVMLKASLEQ